MARRIKATSVLAVSTSLERKCGQDQSGAWWGQFVFNDIALAEIMNHLPFDGGIGLGDFSAAQR